MILEIKRHSWQQGGENYNSDFTVYIDDKPRRDIDCSSCRFYRGDGADCEKVASHTPDDSRLYPFCGIVCGYFEL